MSGERYNAMPRIGNDYRRVRRGIRIRRVARIAIAVILLAAYVYATHFAANGVFHTIYLP